MDAFGVVRGRRVERNDSGQVGETQRSLGGGCGVVRVSPSGKAEGSRGGASVMHRGVMGRAEAGVSVTGVRGNVPVGPRDRLGG